MPRGIQDSSRREFIKKEKIHQTWKCASASRQERCIESASKWLKLRKTKGGKRSPKCSFNRDMKDSKKKKKKKKKEKKPARLKIQKGSLGKS